MSKKRYKLVQKVEYRVKDADYYTWYELWKWHEGWFRKYWEPETVDLFEEYSDVGYHAVPVVGNKDWALRTSKHLNIPMPRGLS